MNPKKPDYFDDPFWRHTDTDPDEHLSMLEDKKGIKSAFLRGGNVERFVKDLLQACLKSEYEHIFIIVEKPRNRKDANRAKQMFQRLAGALKRHGQKHLIHGFVLPTDLLEEVLPALHDEKGA